MITPLTNHILVKPIGNNSEVNGYYIDTSYKPEFHTQVAQEVVAVPKKLKVLDPMHPYAMDWETEQEVQVGDIAYFNKLSVMKAQKLGEYLLIPYQRCYCVKRGEQIIPINGYTLIEPVLEEQKLKSEVLVLDCVAEYAEIVAKDITHQASFRNDLKPAPKLKELKSQGIVRYIGKPNKRYVDDRWHDNVDVQVGDYVYLVDMTYPKLEPELHQTIGNYYCVQRRHIMGVQM
jgi:hypothetical protein